MNYFTFEQCNQMPIVKAVLSKFKIADQELISGLFYRTQLNHHFAWESDERKKQHSLDNISKITWNKKERCFQVYYKATNQFSAEWYHYTLDGKWY